MKKCNACKETNKDNAKFCIKCGEQFSNFTPLCPDCKSVINPDDVFCNKCGKRIIESESKQEAAKKTTSKYIEKSVVRTGSNRNFKIFLGLISGFTAVAVIVLLLVFVIDIGNLTNPFKSTAEAEEDEQIAEKPEEDDLEETVGEAAAASEEEEDEQIAELSKEELSADQIRVISFFGHPDQFTIIFDEGNNNERIDTWIYSDMNAFYVFEDGVYNDSDEYFGEEFQQSRYGLLPQDFTYGMTPLEVEKLIGQKGSESFDEYTGLDALIFGEGEVICIFNPDNQLIIASKQNKLSNET